MLFVQFILSTLAVTSFYMQNPTKSYKHIQVSVTYIEDVARLLQKEYSHVSHMYKSKHRTPVQYLEVTFHHS